MRQQSTQILRSTQERVIDIATDPQQTEGSDAALVADLPDVEVSQQVLPATQAPLDVRSSALAILAARRLNQDTS
jgi:hypothetical protein